MIKISNLNHLESTNEAAKLYGGDATNNITVKQEGTAVGLVGKATVINTSKIDAKAIDFRPTVIKFLFY
ncbi:MAG: hypothetical protein KME64_23035 [Scytonematopsis contorta HA4267-MV1]|jgi:hypothetical protein|nr:hypothetical protein [Scytonematopsis contorta HA4267-MV1]